MILQFLFKINRFISFYNKTNTQQSKYKKQMLKEYFLVNFTMSVLTQLTAQTLIGCIIYMGFGITSIFFMKEVFTNYYSKATSFKIYEEDMEELPTVTICPLHDSRKYDYGQDFTIRYSEFNFTLHEGQNVLFDESISVYEEVHLKKITTYVAKQTCFVLSTNVTLEEFEKIFGWATIRIEYNLSLTNEDLPSLRFYLTSQANAYGMISNFWVDGEVLTLDLDKFTYEFQIDITSKKYVYLLEKLHCQNGGYYERVMLSNDFSTCAKKCLPLFLPKVDIPMCQNNNESNCIIQHMGKILNVSMLKSCQTLEFHGKVTMNRRSKVNIHRTITFYYLITQPKHVIVNEEYLVYNFIGLVASIGGTLGLFIGFSFTNLATSLLNTLMKLRKSREEDVDINVEFTHTFMRRFEETQLVIKALQMEMEHLKMKETV